MEQLLGAEGFAYAWQNMKKDEQEAGETMVIRV